MGDCANPDAADSQVMFHINQLKLAAKLMVKEEETNKAQQLVLDSSKILNVSYKFEEERIKTIEDIENYTNLLKDAFYQLSPSNSPQESPRGLTSPKISD